MTEGFQTVLAASPKERRDLFIGAADRLRTNEQNIEKDFWVCWTLDALFNELEAGGPRLLFKGGTSLSKGYGLIERFSEDIDITVFREDIGQFATVEELEALSGKKRNNRLEAIKAACQEYIHGPMLEQLSALRQTLQTANLEVDRARVEADPDDPDRQSLDGPTDVCIAVCGCGGIPEKHASGQLVPPVRAMTGGSARTLLRPYIQPLNNLL